MGRRMTTIRLKYIKEYRLGGETYRYFRRKGCPAIRLLGEASSREFRQAYEAALAEKPIIGRAGEKGTMAWAIQEYFGAVEFANLKPSSRTLYRIVLEPIAKHHGHRLVRDMGRDNALKIIETIGKTKPGMANLTRAVLHRFMRYCVKRGLRNDNPVAGIDPYEIGTRHTWTDVQLAAFEKRWPLGTRERLVYASLLYSGQRGGDVVRMARPAPKATAIPVIQQKTGVELIIPIHPEWRRAIKAFPAKGLSLIHDARGQPIKRPMLTLIIREAVESAKLPPECTAHGLRKAMMRRLAEQGSTTKQIAAVSGHKTLKEIERYTAAADQVRLAEEAIGGL